MRFPTRVFGALFLLAVRLPAQAPAFEVASVKLSEDRSEGYIDTTPDSLTMESTLGSIIRWAYDVPNIDHLSQLSGPPLLGQQRYHIAAKASGPVPVKQLKLMLQNLLAERLKLAVHRETKEFTVYALIVAKGGPKFKESGMDGESETKTDPKRPGTGFTSVRTSMAQLANLLAGTFPDPLVDMTGLNGRYDFTLDIGSYLVGLQPGELPSIANDALQKQLGLGLEHRKVPLEVLVVDHVEKAPIEN
jgi:uncharacterized protein (TIGR03435 family)